MSKQKWIVDSDPGCDDMMAILYLLKRKDIDILMISLVDGNVSLENVSINSKKILKLGGRATPLHRGSSFPIIKEIANEESYHYCDGLGDIEEIKKFEAHEIEIERESSIIKLIEYALIYPGEINLLCLGPLTSIAAAYMLYPGIEKLFKSIFMMGGSTQSKGNVLPASEFNFAYDFIAAKIVITHFSNIFLTPWEPTEELMVRDHTIKSMHDKILGKNKKINETLFYYITRIIAKFTADKNGTQLCDLYSVITAFEPKCVIKFSRFKCDVIIDSLEMLGMLYVKSIKEINIPFDYFLENVQHHLAKFESGSHIVIEELCEITIFDQYEIVLTI